MRYIIIAVLIITINVILFVVLSCGHRIGYTVDDARDISYGDVRLMHDYDGVKIFESCDVSGEYYIASEVGISHIVIDYLAPFKSEGVLPCNWDFAKDEVLYNKSFVTVAVDTLCRRSGMYRLSKEIVNPIFSVENK